MEERDNHHQLPQVPQRDDDVLDHAIREVVVLWVAAEVAQRQDGQRRQRRDIRRARQPRRRHDGVEDEGALGVRQVLQHDEAEVAGRPRQARHDRGMNGGAHQQPAGRGVFLQPGRQVHARTVDVVLGRRDLAHVKRDAQCERRRVGLRAIRGGEPFLYLERPGERPGGRREFGEDAVAVDFTMRPSCAPASGRRMPSSAAIQRRWVRPSSVAMRIV